MRILVTGGAGLIGAHLVSKIIAAGHEAIAFDSFQFSHFAPMNSFEAEALAYRFDVLLAGATTLRGSTTSKRELAGVLSDHSPDCVIHLAATPLVTMATSHPEEAKLSIFDGTINLLELLRQKTSVKRFVYISSSMVYGDFTQDPMPETGPTRPVNIYGALKLAGEVATASYLRNSPIEPVVVRPSAVYGPTDVNRRVVQLFCENALLNRPLRVKSSRDTVMDFSFVQDVADGLLLAATQPGAAGRTFNITRGEGRSLDELAEAVQAYAGRRVQIEREPSFDTDRPRRGSLDISQAREFLGYSPKFGLEQGVANYLRHLRSQPDSVPQVA
ncbi:NAD(P)-dependent oxidoreductase [Methylobacterium sp. C25]|uniref:NAD-dependent epimerase/dehydratase family protein n=1 Tax=Methylobacterium sp. C25 TaxID=2721622 RepID=UPI001F2B8FEF|nr:NAD(P)-dependent oxidoreductase [Methylobacterium sp. C25]MCE4225037.1 NAD(P)-dependent oxidoreductase [Methylobacterium sp. C25]